jgi:hypothetical protein
MIIADKVKEVLTVKKEKVKRIINQVKNQEH